MTTNASGSANIYAFPPRGRFLARTASETVESLAPARQPAVRIVSGSGWYHDEAIAQTYQAEPRQKN
jgi:hypothetical protein